MHGAVAVDLGATSGRFAAGRLVDGRIEFEVIEQIPHEPLERKGRLEWDIEALKALCQRAVEYADSQFESATVGIDSWGVDHGFLDSEGNLVQAPVCYRDLSHASAHDRLRGHLDRLYQITGIQHQPFNTISQLLARRLEDPSMVQNRWLMLPDLLGHLLGAGFNYEMTDASTTQLVGLDDRWSLEAFDMIGWPVPDLQPSLPGKLGEQIGARTRLAHVGSHDTASAVAGFGALADDQMFLNVGTWSLAGTVIDRPLVTEEIAKLNLTNERCVDGRVRLLKNVPGFYVINRLHQELEVKASVPQWLASAQSETDDVVDLFHEAFFNPHSMVTECCRQITVMPETKSGWAHLALASLVEAVAQQPSDLARVTGRSFSSIRVGGGGSQSTTFCQALADRTGLRVTAGPAEATVLGNLAVQFLASGHIANWGELWSVAERSAETRRYEPR
jgi:rhamnulokinase